MKGKTEPQVDSPPDFSELSGVEKNCLELGEFGMAVDRLSTPIEDALEAICENGFDGLGKAVEKLLNVAMRIERSRYMGADEYQRSGERKTYANGYKNKTVSSRVGELKLLVPQTRDSAFYPECLTRGLRSERALTMALAEMYVGGVATRRVKGIVEEMCGFEVSASAVSRAAKELDESLEAWRNRPIGVCPFLLIDALYTKVRMDGVVRDCALLVAMGISEDGKKEVLGVHLGLSEAEVNWRVFLESLLARGLKGMLMVASDDHSGLGAARRAVLPSVPWQRCQFHFQKNAQMHLTKTMYKSELAKDLRAVFNARDEEEAREILKGVISKYRGCQSKLADWLENNAEETLTVFKMDEKLRRRLRTTNALERLNGEIRRRIKTVGMFPNPESCLRLCTAVTMETSEEWETGRRYLNLDRN